MPPSLHCELLTGECDWCHNEIFCHGKQRDAFMAGHPKAVCLMLCVNCAAIGHAIVKSMGKPSEFVPLRSKEVAKHFIQG
jgi:hypothetical protein